MYSPEFMKFLIDSQTPEYNEKVDKEVKSFKFSLKNIKLAAVFLVNKK